MLGVFGGSFDPPHRGHLAIIKSFSAEYNCPIYVVPNYVSPFKEKKGAATFDIIKMLEILKKENNLEKMEILDWEIKRGGKSFTCDTIDEVIKIFSETEIYLLIGEDNLSSLDRWKNIKYILNKCKILVYLRPVSERVEIPLTIQEFSHKIIIKKNPENPASSSMFREKSIEEYLTPSVLGYIKENHLYDN